VASATGSRRRQHTRGSKSMRVGDRCEAKSTDHAARAWHLRVVRIAHGCTSQLTLGRSPDCVGGRQQRGPVGGGGGTSSCRRVVGL